MVATVDNGSNNGPGHLVTQCPGPLHAGWPVCPFPRSVHRPTYHAGVTVTRAPAEAQIRQALLRGLSAKAAPSTRLVEEFRVPRVHVRADVAVVGSRLCAFEIKSEADTLRRLPAQVDGFSAIFDACSLVVAPGHLDEAIEMVPVWWGVVLVGHDAPTLTELRPALPNPQVDVALAVRLLWRSEVEQALVTRGVTPDYVGGRAGMWQQLLEAVDEPALRATVRAALGSRTEWRGTLIGDPAPAC